MGTENENKQNQGQDQEQVSFDPSPNTAFVREKIKQKPINRKKLVRRTALTILMAAVFGVVACVTFLLLEPVISKNISSGTVSEEEKPVQVSFSETQDDTEDEILPEDMYATDTEMISEALQGNVTEVNENIKNIEDMISSMEFGMDDYQKLYRDFRSLSESISVSLVTVTAVTEGTDLLNNPYEDSAQTSGVIVADNRLSYLILVKDNGLTDADAINVVFSDGSSASGEVMGKDSETSLLIVGVRKNHLSSETLEVISPASLGSSRSTVLKGTPVMALGAPTGTSDSVAYGMITAASQQLYMTDSDSMIFSTDIMGTESSSGVIASLRGNIIGIIDNTYDSETAPGVISAVGITELKPLIEKLSNGEDKAYFGVQAMDVTNAMKSAYGLPEGIYLRYIEIDSPAMNAGLQNGDILTEVNGKAINTYHDFILWLYDTSPGTTVNMTIKRQSVDSYVDVNCEVVLGSVTYVPTVEE
ncbi:MAG: S1C family serine protease [Lachnospiraceae bacterium]|nr:S1C family serine protease [Lachnospiraceae bacterium]